MPAVLWVLAIGSYWTFAHRMYHTWKEVNKPVVNDPAAALSKTEPATADLPRNTTLVHKTG